MRKVVEKKLQYPCLKCNKIALEYKLFDDGKSEFIHERKPMKINGQLIGMNVIKICYLDKN